MATFSLIGIWTHAIGPDLDNDANGNGNGGSSALMGFRVLMEGLSCDFGGGLCSDYCSFNFYLLVFFCRNFRIKKKEKYKYQLRKSNEKFVILLLLRIL